MRDLVIYWVTRDSDESGVLDSCCDVWLEQPRRHRFSPTGGAMWLDQSEGLGKRHCHASYESLLGWRHTLPDTDIECIRVETVGPAK